MMYDAVMCDDGGDQGLVMMGEGGGDSLSAGPWVTMEMWTPGTRTLPQPGLCTALLGHISTLHKEHLWNPSQHHRVEL